MLLYAIGLLTLFLQSGYNCVLRVAISASKLPSAVLKLRVWGIFVHILVGFSAITRIIPVSIESYKGFAKSFLTRKFLGEL